MCGLCGVLGGADHWAEPVEGAPGASAAPHRQARQIRTRIANRILDHYHLRLEDWMGRSYLLRGRTGATAIVPHLGALWPAAERLAKRECDPLDAALLAALGDKGAPRRVRRTRSRR